jgi:hypothetical protein
MMISHAFSRVAPASCLSFIMRTIVSKLSGVRDREAMTKSRNEPLGLSLSLILSGSRGLSPAIALARDSFERYVLGPRLTTIRGGFREYAGGGGFGRSGATNSPSGSPSPSVPSGRS